MSSLGNYFYYYYYYFTHSRVFMLSSSRFIDVSVLSSILVIPLLPPFFDTYNLCHLSDVRSYISIISCCRHGYPWPSLATSPYHSSPLAGLHPVSSHSCWMYVRAGHPAFARPYVGVHRSTSLMSSSLLLQQWPACLVRLTWIVFMMGGRWPYSWCLVRCCRQDLFNIARNILV